MRILIVTISWTTTENLKCAPYITRHVESLRRAGIDADVFCFRGQKAPANYFRAWRQVRNRLKTRTFDLVHAYSGQSGVVTLPPPLPLVVTFNGSDLLGIPGPSGSYTAAGTALRYISRLVAMFASEAIVVSKQLSTYLPGRRHHVIPHGVDLEMFRPASREEARVKLGLPLERRLVLFPANPAKSTKRFSLAKASVDLLNETLPAELVVANDVPHESMPLYINACDALLITSRHEGSPNPVKEALACGLPVVSLDVGDVRQRVGNIEGCVVCEDDRSETIAAALASVLSRKQRIKGRDAVQDFDERIVTQRIISVYTQALSRR